MSGRSPEEREQARREREIRRLERAGEPVPPELREPVRASPPPPPVAPTPVPPPREPDPTPEPPHVPPAPAPPAHEPEPEPFTPAVHDTGEHRHDVYDTGEHPHAPYDDTGDHPVYHPETGEHDVEPLAAPALSPAFTTVGGPPVKTPRPRRGLRRRWGIALLVAGGLLVVLVAWFAVQVFQPFGGPSDEQVAVKIPEGSSTATVGDILEKAGVIDSSFFFQLRVRLDGAALRSGAYQGLHKGEHYDTVIKTLSTPPVAAKTVSVSIPEGLSRKEIAPRAKEAGLTGSYVKASVKSPRLDPRKYGAPKGTPNLEGFLFPATYELKRKSSVEKLVDLQLSTFKKEIAAVDLAYARKKNLTVYDILIIASMVDRETAVAKDRPKVAAVIYNRLKAKIPLGIDATTRYQYGDWKNPIKQSQLDSSSPYNTRKNLGLPPTPIGNPGRAAIEAAANPSRKDYLFFVVKPCGNGASAFSSTNEQFLKDEAAYNAARAKNGGNDPSRCKG